MYGWRGKIGLLVPSINTTMEVDFHRFVPAGITVHTGRVKYDGSPVAPEPLARMATYLEDAARDVASAKVDVIVYGCTSGSFFKGTSWDDETANHLTEVTGIPTVTTSQSVREALHALGITHLGVGTPYPEPINERLRAYFEEAGFKVVRVIGLGIGDVWEHGRLTPEEIYQLGRRVAAKPANGVLIACTQLRACEIIETLERDTGLPAVGAVQASLWKALRMIGLREEIKSLGQLCRSLNQ